MNVARRSDERARRRRSTRLSWQTIEALECLFLTTPYPRYENLQVLADEYGETVKRLRTWFTSRRVKARAELAGKTKGQRKKVSRVPEVQASTSSGSTEVHVGAHTRASSGSTEVHVGAHTRASSGSTEVHVGAHTRDVEKTIDTELFIPSRKCHMPSETRTAFYFDERDADLIEDKEYHEILNDSDW